ncbi:MAG TPA: YlxR family protein [Dietzia timorensis]|uniref:YlxR family protein n=1 Tax=Dietzia timorensis TaxID=499555 RepID=A0A921JY50_9ACTN|nr:YlxR family protein [Dietzia timorensis]HJE90829.1 YlxR family protein [Dietzia timorensis]
MGCRRSEPLSDDLVRVVAVEHGSSIVPDRSATMAGRGAWVHRNADCVRTALERKAFPRSLRVGLNADVSALNEFVAQLCGDQTIPPADAQGRRSEEMDRNR